MTNVRPHDIHRFILERARHVRRSYAKLMVTALRSFLRFLHQRGAIALDLAAAVPGVAHWRLSHLPKSLPPEQVERLLESCDRNTQQANGIMRSCCSWRGWGCVPEKWSR